MSDVLCELLADFYRGDYVIEPVRKEIERLRAEIERLRACLDKIAKHPDTTELIKQFAQGRIKAAEGEGA